MEVISIRLRAKKNKVERDGIVTKHLCDKYGEACLDLCNFYSYHLYIPKSDMHIMLYTSTLKVYTQEFGTFVFETLSELDKHLEEILEYERSQQSNNK
jgi:hypothetical protein